MTRTIWKYALEVTGWQEIEMPAGAKILCAQMQGSSPCVWAEVDPDAPVETRRLGIAGTGHGLPREMVRYIGTVQVYGGGLVWHVYEGEVRK